MGKKSCVKRTSMTHAGTAALQAADHLQDLLGLQQILAQVVGEEGQPVGGAFANQIRDPEAEAVIQPRLQP